MLGDGTHYLVTVKIKIMDSYTVKRLALVLAVQAEIDGMKARNKIEEVNGHEPPHGFEEFKNKSVELQNLAYTHDEQL